MEVRPATAAERPAVMAVLEGSLLEVDARAVGAAIPANRVLVATETGPVLGAVVLVPEESGTGVRIDAIAVRPRRRRQGIGTALVRAAAARHGPLVAAFDADVRRFWASLGFDIEPAAEPGRYVGTLNAPGG